MLQDNILYKFSIITVCYNSSSTLEDTIKSVLNQSYKHIEYIIIDGASSDNTLDIINKYAEQIDVIISEKDKGIYDALNKGVRIAQGDIIGFLHSDDIFHSNKTIDLIAKIFDSDHKTDATIGNVQFVNDKGKVVRYSSSKYWKKWMFKIGIMPPHPSYFCKKNIYLENELFRIDYKISADFELMLRHIISGNVQYKINPVTTTIMRLGGLSTSGFMSTKQINNEIYRALKSNNIFASYILIYSKYFYRILELMIVRLRK